MDAQDTSIAFKLFGHRSLLSWLFGTFFSNASNTSGVLAILLVVAVFFFYFKNGTVPDPLLNVLMIIVGFYFGGARAGRDQLTGRELP
jgi:4-hydroxybenzoate polyprenyltransferase